MILIKGTTRYVFLTKKNAIKIPSLYSWRCFLNGLLSNMQEVEFSKMNDERLCPVKFYLFGWFMVVMPRCKEVSINEYKNVNISVFWPNSEEDYHPYNECERVKFNVPVENKRDSFGIYNGKIVAIDYGS